MVNLQYKDFRKFSQITLIKDSQRILICLFRKINCKTKFSFFRLDNLITMTIIQLIGKKQFLTQIVFHKNIK